MPSQASHPAKAKIAINLPPQGICRQYHWPQYTNRIFLGTLISHLSPAPPGPDTASRNPRSCPPGLPGPRAPSSPKWRDGRRLGGPGLYVYGASIGGLNEAICKVHDSLLSGAYRGTAATGEVAAGARGAGAGPGITGIGRRARGTRQPDQGGVWQGRHCHTHKVSPG